MVFDERGNQVHQLQRQHTERRAVKLLAFTTPQTKFALAKWSSLKLSWKKTITRERFMLGWIGEGSCHARGVE